MHERFLGDSYDIVKRYWRELLSPIAPLYAHPRFVPSDLRNAYTRLTGISMWTGNALDTYALLIDPHTGIPMPDAVAQNLRLSHSPIGFIAGLFSDPKLAYILCFDQTSDRNHKLSIADQPEAKREALRASGLYSFYYQSHAPFLFASNNHERLLEVRARILGAGIPESTSNGPRVQQIVGP